MNSSKIKDYTEPFWFLGTDVITESDQQLMNDQTNTIFHREEGAIYCVPTDKDHFNLVITEFKISGYSNDFIDIFKEAHRRKYHWIFFDRDIETEFKP